MADSFHIVGFKPYDRPARGSTTAGAATTATTQQQYTTAEVTHTATTVL
jgi:hypothetical protein